MLENILQLLLFAGSAGAIYLLSSPDTRKIGWWVNLAVEPIWFYTSFKNGQWGIFALAFFYTYCIIRGLKNEYALHTESK
jgi:hypothetical protein